MNMTTLWNIVEQFLFFTAAALREMPLAGSLAVINGDQVVFQHGCFLAHISRHDPLV